MTNSPPPPNPVSRIEIHGLPPEGSSIGRPTTGGNLSASQLRNRYSPQAPPPSSTGSVPGTGADGDPGEDGTPFDWRAFLQRWSQEWLQNENCRAQAPPEVLASGWLGYSGATDEQIAAAEARLDARLPPSYRAFMRVSNGWRRTSPFISRLWSTHGIDCLSARSQSLIDTWTKERGPWSEYLPTALEISDWGDGVYLLNSRVVRPDGEWEAAFFASWVPGARVYGSFRELMDAEYASFHELRGKGLACEVEQKQQTQVHCDEQSCDQVSFRVDVAKKPSENPGASQPP